MHYCHVIFLSRMFFILCTFYFLLCFYKWVALCCLLYNSVSLIIIPNRKRTNKRQWERQQKPDMCSKTSRQQSRRSAPVHDTLSSKPPLSPISPPPIKAGPALPPSAGWACFSDLHFIDASRTHPFICVLISPSFLFLSLLITP